MLILTREEETLNDTKPNSMDTDLHTYGFPPGYFMIKNVATNRVLDVESDLVEDGTPIILYTETETSIVEEMRNPDSNNQVFFIDTSGALCSRSSGHAIDIEGEELVLRHRRPVSHPFPNAYSHPLPRFAFDKDTGHIAVSFTCDPSYPSSASREAALSSWKRKTYLLTAIPLRKPRTIIDDASHVLSSAISVPFSLFGGHSGAAKSTPDEVFNGDIDLREDEIIETERSEEGEVDNSYEKHRKVRVIGYEKEELHAVGVKARERQKWVVMPLRNKPRKVTDKLLKS